MNTYIVTAKGTITITGGTAIKTTEWEVQAESEAAAKEVICVPAEVMTWPVGTVWSTKLKVD